MSTINPDGTTDWVAVPALRSHEWAPNGHPTLTERLAMCYSYIGPAVDAANAVGNALTNPSGLQTLYQRVHGIPSTTELHENKIVKLQNKCSRLEIANHEKDKQIARLSKRLDDLEKKR